MAEAALSPTMEQGLRRVTDPAELRSAIQGWRARGLNIAFVPTMGALHEGHLSLVARGLEAADRVVASIFVNPTQFGPHEDLSSYPRSVEADCRRLEDAGCRLVFLPSVETIYPPGGRTFVDVEGPSKGFEGAQRPGHFRGVATVVLKLFNLVQPDVAVFGEKDAQQLAVVRQMTHDLHLPIEIIGAPIVREKDGLALSSRNVYLDSDQRRASQVLSRALAGAESAIRAGESNPRVLEDLVRSELESEPTGRTDYVAVVDGGSFEPLTDLSDFRGRLVIAAAFRLGTTRLLDNLQIDLNGPKTGSDRSA